MFTVHLGASNSFHSLIQPLANEVFANHVLSFAHMDPLSILGAQDNWACPCLRIGNSEKIHNDFLLGPKKIKINKKSWI